MADIGQGLSEVEAPEPVQNKNEAHVTFHRSLEDEVASQRKRRSRSPFQFSFYIDSTPRDSPSVEGDDTEGTQEYSAPPSVANLAEAAPGGIVENPNERGAPHPRRKAGKASRLQTNVFIWAHIVVFSILGTLARVGLSLLTAYPAEPARFTSLWPNFGSSLVLGFLSEGAELFRHPKAARSLSRAPPVIAKEDTGGWSASDTEAGGREKEGGRPAAESPPLAVPLHIGLATGFCGSFTTYSAFMRDSFEALAGVLGTTSGPSPGQDFTSVAAVIIITISMSIGGLKAGAHVAIFLKRYEKKLPRRVLRGMDRASVVLGAALWACAIAMAIEAVGREKMMAWKRDLEDYSRNLDAQVEYYYMNYADGTQDVLGSYGEERVQMALEVAARYDPTGVFQKRVVGGFKLPNAAKQV
ncbi:hypothetical protein INS49_004294 [Diaporthe citri]|uniref:uncharacterized protein n=1 Tax=Diaporthe citri TaxID=83186 RepID=UPI001C809AAD|nr:uncharacterized protein INS49_004294 [Diaporthe citri]KAG6355213.1 hypothetical protein INS49_004294 [Diaporthe citri]